MTAQITYVVPYYRAPAMLAVHLMQWMRYSKKVREHIQLVVVDDCSPEPAEPIVLKALLVDPTIPVALLRISDDIPWNRNGARNLGSHVAKTPWVMHTDIDHILPPADALALAIHPLRPALWYRFRRFRVGAADETRNKDSLARDVTFGEIKPHGDSYLCTRERYWQAGGYDEDYSGHLGGGSPFLKELSRPGEPIVLPFALHVYTRHAIGDASVSTLSRDTAHYTKTSAQKRAKGETKGKNPLRFVWERIV